MASKSRRREERRQRRVRVAMGIFITAIMVFSTFAFVLVFYAPQNDTSQSRFTVRDGRLFTQVDGREMMFYSYPDPSIGVPEEALALVRGADTLVVLFDPSREEDLPYVDQVRFDLQTALPVRLGAAVTEPSAAYPFVEASCANATQQVPFLAVRDGNGSVSVNGSCIVVEASGQDLLRVRDQLLYRYYGVS